MACSLAHFSVFSQVGNLGCIEFLTAGRGSIPAEGTTVMFGSG